MMHHLPYFFSERITPHSVFALNDETAKHIIQVLRMKKDEHILLTDGKGNKAEAIIVQADKRNCSVHVKEILHEGTSSKKISIAISILKNATRFEWFLEKATEIGISEIIPLICSRTERQYFRYERMLQIIISALLQSRQSYLPVLHQPTDFKTAITELNYDGKFIAHCIDEEKKTIQEISNSASPVPANAIILIGPEGDFTKEEITYALQNNYISVSLGNTRLRTETAGIVAATLLV